MTKNPCIYLLSLLYDPLKNETKREAKKTVDAINNIKFLIGIGFLYGSIF